MLRIGVEKKMIKSLPDRLWPYPQGTALSRHGRWMRRRVGLLGGGHLQRKCKVSAEQLFDLPFDLFLFNLLG